MQRWERVYVELQRKAEKLGYQPPSQIGSSNSQVFEFRIKGKPVLLLAFRDLARSDDYKLPNRLWAEGLELVLERFEELTRHGQTLPQAAAIVTDNIGDAFVVVMMNELVSLYHEKGAFRERDGHRRFTFTVEREPDGYFLQMPYGQPHVRLSSVNSVDSLLLLLKAAKQPSALSQ